MSTSSNDGDSESLNNPPFRRRLDPQIRVYTYGRGRNRGSSDIYVYQNYPRQPFSSRSNTRRRCRSRQWRQSSNDDTESSSGSDDSRTGEGRRKERTQAQHCRDCFPPGCNMGQFYCNQNWPHTHHRDHNHTEFAQGYAFAQPNYPEHGMPDPVPNIARVEVHIRRPDACPLLNSPERVYTCRRDHIHEYLPRSRVLGVERRWEPMLQINEGRLFSPAMDEIALAWELGALNVVFRGLEEADRTNHMDLFWRMRYRLRHEARQLHVLADAISLVRGMGETLSWDRGLGCSEALMDQIVQFVMGLIPQVRRLLPPHTVSDLVVPMGALWCPTDTRHNDTMSMIWRSLDGWEQGDVRGGLEARARDGRGANYARMLAQLDGFGN